MVVDKSKTAKTKRKSKQIQVKKPFTKADAFLLFEATGVEQTDTIHLFNFREKQLIIELLKKELQEMSDNNNYQYEDKLVKQSLLSKIRENREQVIESIYLKLHEPNEHE